MLVVALAGLGLVGAVADREPHSLPSLVSRAVINVREPSHVRLSINVTVFNPAEHQQSDIPVVNIERPSAFNKQRLVAALSHTPMRMQSEVFALNLGLAGPVVLTRQIDSINGKTNRYIVSWRGTYVRYADVGNWPSLIFNAVNSTIGHREISPELLAGGVPRNAIGLPALVQGDKNPDDAGERDDDASARDILRHRRTLRCLFRSDSGAPLSAKIGAVVTMSLIAALCLYRGIWLIGLGRGRCVDLRAIGMMLLGVAVWCGFGWWVSPC